MQGLSKSTYTPLTNEAHLQQSILDILSTPTGSRVMRRDYGSILPDLLDAPQNSTTAMRFINGVAHAVHQWEPRVTKITKINFTATRDGQQHVNIQTEQGDLQLTITENGVFNIG